MVSRVMAAWEGVIEERERAAAAARVFCKKRLLSKPFIWAYPSIVVTIQYGLVLVAKSQEAPEKIKNERNGPFAILMNSC
jgi:hypothetical protein